MASRQTVVVLGAPRSGTTWLQNLLASDPAIVTPQETDLFTRYVQPLVAAWDWSLRGTPDDWRARRFKGLPAVLTRSQFDEAVRGFVEEVLSRVQELDPAATTVLEKSPSHSLVPEVIARYVPGVRFVHLVRDGRDAAASLVAAAHGWGAAWAPRSVASAACVWRDHVAAACGADQHGPYLELRYEELRGPEGPRLLQGVFAFCGIEVGVAEAAARMDAFSVGGTARTSIVFGGETSGCEGVGAEPEGFARSGEGGGWSSWSLADRVAFADEAQPWLERLGYASNDQWVGEVSAARRARRVRRWRRTSARVVRSAAYRAAGRATQFGALDPPT